MMNLQGLRVLNTRPVEQGKTLSELIKAAGGIAIECPALVITPTNQDWLKTIPNLNNVAQAIFISANAVNCCFATLTKAELEFPTSIQFIAVGQGTASALKLYKHNEIVIPDVADSEHLLKIQILQQVKNKIILLFKGEGGRTLIADTLIARGANLHSISVYKRQKPCFNREEIDSLWRNDAVDIILFTSQQAMNNIVALFGQNAEDWLRSKPCLVLSERLAKEATLLGIKKVIVSAPEKILITLHQFNKGLIHGQ